MRRVRGGENSQGQPRRKGPLDLAESAPIFRSGRQYGAAASQRTALAARLGSRPAPPLPLPPCVKRRSQCCASASHRLSCVVAPRRRSANRCILRCLRRGRDSNAAASDEHHEPKRRAQERQVRRPESEQSEKFSGCHPGAHPAALGARPGVGSCSFSTACVRRLVALACMAVRLGFFRRRETPLAHTTLPTGPGLTGHLSRLVGWQREALSSLQRHLAHNEPPPLPRTTIGP